uniref:Probable DNA polymerase n=1 Tax=Coniferiporia sulphurascens TaxID=175648 RepID=A0A5B9R9L9_CONSH|nr:DNA polymerase family B [Coniferiporia sulphurascens]QEG57191.1 DNA polymerase family B [Coniferiporia sulphurascens]
MRAEWYKSLQPTHIVFNWIDCTESDYKRNLFNQKLSERRMIKNKLSDTIEAPKGIPFNTIYESWGTTLTKINDKLTTITEVSIMDSVKHILVEREGRDTSTISIYFEDGEVLHFSDTKISMNDYRRLFEDGREYYFEFSNPYFFKENYTSSKSITVSSKDLGHEFKAITLDLETYMDKGVHKVLAACFYDGADNHWGNGAKTFYITDYKTEGDLYKAIFNLIFQNNYNQYNLYLHNGASFDLIFILKHLAKYPGIKINPTYKDGKFINIEVKYGKDYKASINIKDSYMLLLSSLAKLGKQFGVETLKDVYPYSFPNKNNLNYVGAVPEYSFFESSKVSLEDYNNYKNRFNADWDLKK